MLICAYPKEQFERRGHMTSDINKINEQIEKLEYQIMRSRSEINPARVSAFRYFWPFLVLSIIGAGMAYIYSFV